MREGAITAIVLSALVGLMLLLFTPECKAWGIEWEAGAHREIGNGGFVFNTDEREYRGEHFFGSVYACTGKSSSPVRLCAGAQHGSVPFADESNVGGSYDAAGVKLKGSFDF